MGNRIRPFLLTLFVGFILLGCSQGNDFKPLLAEFQRSTVIATTATKAYYAGLNQYERELYLQERLFNDTLRVATTDREGKPTPLLSEPFDPEALQGRIALLEQISLYGQQLALLAGNETPAQTEKNLAALAGNLTNLNTTFEELSKKNDLEAGKYLGPVSAILGVVAKTILEKKRNTAVREAIQAGQKPVDELLSFLEQDLRKYVETTRNTGQKMEVADWVNYYNRNSRKLTFTQRQQVLNQIKQAAAELELLKKSQPADVVTGLRAAHAALVQYAGSGGKASDLGTLVSAVKSFQDEARQLVDAAVAIQKLTSEK